MVFPPECSVRPRGVWCFPSPLILMRPKQPKVATSIFVLEFHPCSLFRRFIRSIPNICYCSAHHPKKTFTQSRKTQIPSSNRSSNQSPLYVFIYAKKKDEWNKRAKIHRAWLDSRRHSRKGSEAAAAKWVTYARFTATSRDAPKHKRKSRLGDRCRNPHTCKPSTCENNLFQAPQADEKTSLRDDL